MLSQRRGVTQSPVRSGGREASCIPRSRPNRTTDAISADSLLLSLRGTPATREGSADIPLLICLSCDGPGEFWSIPNCAESPVACLERRRAEFTVSGHSGGQIADFRAVSRSSSHFLGCKEMVGRRKRGSPVSGLSSVEYMRWAFVARLSNTIKQTAQTVARRFPSRCMDEYATTRQKATGGKPAPDGPTRYSSQRIHTIAYSVLRRFTQLPCQCTVLLTDNPFDSMTEKSSLCRRPGPHIRYHWPKQMHTLMRIRRPHGVPSSSAMGRASL